MGTPNGSAPTRPTAEIEVMRLPGADRPRRAGAAPRRATALVLGGGVALGAFGAGAYAALHGSDALPVPWAPVSWVCGSSIGAVLGAIIAGNPPEQRVAQLRRFWDAVSSDPAPALSFWIGTPNSGPVREWLNQTSVMQTMVLGRPDLFRPRLAPGARAGVSDVSALYDLEPLGRYLAEFVDFDRLNDGLMRVTVVTTDVVAGERVVFDTARGDRIGVSHVLASCALMPAFAPVEVDGRLLGDGGLSANTPLDLVLGDRDAGGALCCVVELFAPMGQRPHTIAASASRAADLIFGNHTRRLMEAQMREQRLRGMIARLGAMLPEACRAEADVAAMLDEGRGEGPTLVYLGYRGGLDEAGPLSMFDFSRATITDRWEAGERGMRDALAAVADGAVATQS